MAPKTDPVVWQKYIGGYSDSMRYLATQLILFQNRIIISILLEQKDFFFFLNFKLIKLVSSLDEILFESNFLCLNLLQVLVEIN